MRTLRVTGTGKLQLQPDTICLTVKLSRTFPQYADAVRNAAEDTREMRERFASIGLTREQIRSTEYRISPQYDSEQDENGRYRNIFAGYAYTHEMVVRFPLDQALLGKAMRMLAHAPQDPTVTIGYTVSDPEQAKNALLDKAVRDAAAKARVLADAAGVRLGAIEQIDYSWDELVFESRMRQNADLRMMCMDESDEAYAPDVDPVDIRVSDTVTVVWSIAGGGAENG